MRESKVPTKERKTIGSTHVCVCWGVQGAETVYNVLVRPFLLQHREPIDSYVDKIGEAGNKAAEGIQQAVQEGFSLVTNTVGAVRRTRHT